MELDIYYVNFENRDIEGRNLPQTPSQHLDAGKAKKCSKYKFSEAEIVLIMFEELRNAT